MGTLAKQGAAKSDVCGTLLQRNLEITTHSHRAECKIQIIGTSTQLLKGMSRERGVAVRRADGHQTNDVEIE